MNCCFGSTEEKIKAAAKKVFLEKGFDGATTRDIAQEAGLNSALMNYYFRSKEKLFLAVFEELLQLFLQGTTEILNKPISLKEKIAEVIDHDFQTFKKNPSLVNLIFSEVKRNEELFRNVVPKLKMQHIAHLAEQLDQAIAAKEIRPIEVHHLLPLILGNIQTIFLCKPMTMLTWQMNEEGFDKYAEKQKQITIDVIINYLFIDP